LAKKFPTIRNKFLRRNDKRIREYRVSFGKIVGVSGRKFEMDVVALNYLDKELGVSIEILI